MAVKGISKNSDLNSDLAVSRSERFKSMQQEIPKVSMVSSAAQATEESAIKAKDLNKMSDESLSAACK